MRHQFLQWCLIDKKYGVYQYADEEGKKVITHIAKLNGDVIKDIKVSDADWSAAWVGSRVGKVGSKVGSRVGRVGSKERSGKEVNQPAESSQII